MLAMLLVGRLINRLDPCFFLLLGFLLIGISLWEMSGFTAQVSIAALVRTGMTQGLGLGLSFVPLTTIAYATLEPQYRTEAAGLFSLLRNIGSSIGVSIVIGLLARNTQINHAELAEHITPFNPLLQPPWSPSLWDIGQTSGLAALNLEINRQAAMISYLNDFRLMMIMSFCVIPLFLLLRRPQPAPVPVPA